MEEVDRYTTSGGDTITLHTDGTAWQVANLTAEGENIWTENSVTGSHPFTEEEARADFERWRA